MLATLVVISDTSANGLPSSSRSSADQICASLASADATRRFVTFLTVLEPSHWARGTNRGGSASCTS